MRIGILGGGQLGQMMSLAGTPLGIDVSCFDTSTSSPAALAGELVVGELNNTELLHSWAKTLDVLTYEFENFPTELVADLSEHVRVHPNARALAVAQDRWAEKRLFNSLGISVPPFRTATSVEELSDALNELDYPVVVKTRTGGYDGKGQARLRGPEDLPKAEALLEANEVIIERLISFDSETSIIGVRSQNGEVTTYPTGTNEHRDGILHSTSVPSRLPRSIAAGAQATMELLMKSLDYVGVLTLELFVVGEQILANEIAPRVHNSGHWTIEGAETSQFENHLRAIAGLPLGSTALRCPAAMVNLIGKIPPTSKVLAVPGAALHLYGKTERPGRKLGHVTVTASTEGELRLRREAVEAVIRS